MHSNMLIWSLHPIITTQAHPCASRHTGPTTQHSMLTWTTTSGSQVLTSSAHMYSFTYIYEHPTPAGNNTRTWPSPPSLKHSHKLNSHPTPGVLPTSAFLFSSVFPVLECESKVSHMLGKHFTLELHFHPFVGVISCDLGRYF